MKIKHFVFHVFVSIFLLKTTSANADYQEAVTLFKDVVEYVTIAKSAISLGNDVKTAFEKSESVKDFIDNLDPNSQHQKKVETKLEQIHNSVTIIKDKIGHLEFSVDLKHFNSHVKYPTKHVYNAMQKFMEFPTNVSLLSLSSQCHQHPPNSILETLGDILSENWLIDQSQYSDYRSPEFLKNIEKVDEIAESLTIAQAACSGLHGFEDAEYELKQLKKHINLIRKQVEHSKQIIHNYAFNYSKIYVKDYLSTYSKKDKSMGHKNAEIASHLLKHSMKNYNYGAFYTISVSHDKESKYFGNFDETAAYNIRENGIHVFVFRAAECEDLPQNAPGWTCLGRDELINYFKYHCGTKLLCVFGKLTTMCGNNWFDRFLLGSGDSCDDVHASNGGICRLVNSCLDRKLISFPFPTNFTAKTLAINDFFLIKTHNYEYIDANYNPNEAKKDIKGIIQIPFKYVEEKLFIDQDFGDGFNLLSFFKNIIPTTTTTIIPDVNTANLNISQIEVNTFSSFMAKNSSLQKTCFATMLLFITVIFLFL